VRFDIDGMRNCARDEGGRGGEIPRATRLWRLLTFKNLRFEDQIETFTYSFKGLTFGKKPSVLGDPKPPPTSQHIERLPH
jgi:hypothetical protein